MNKQQTKKAKKKEKKRKICAATVKAKSEKVNDYIRVRARPAVYTNSLTKENNNNNKIIKTTHSDYIPIYSWNMLKVLRLVTNNRRNFSLFQLNKLFKQAAINRNTLHNTENTVAETANTMSTAKINGTSEPQPPSTTEQTQNLNGTVKFLELLGKLKVSTCDFIMLFIHRIACEIVQMVIMMRTKKSMWTYNLSDFFDDMLSSWFVCLCIQISIQQTFSVYIYK